MRWYLEKDEQFWSALFDGGNVTVTVGELGGDVETEQLEFADLDEAVAAVRERVSPLFEEGFEQRVPPDERYEPEPRIASFWNEQLLDEWKAMGVTESEPTEYRDRWAEYLACDLPPELDRFLQWRSSHDFGYCNYGEWRIWDADTWLPTRENGNLFEQLVLMDQENYLGTAMMEHLAGWVFLGTAGNGDSYFAHPNHADPNQAEVIFFNHETASPDFAFGDSVASLAWANHCYEQLEAEDFDHDQFVHDFSLIANRVTLPWHYSSLEEEAELEPHYEAKSRGIYYFYRATWIDYLLRQNGVMEVEDVADVFYPDFHSPLKFEDALKSPYLTKTPITALYWVWRLWWFDKPQLQTCLEAVEAHPSPIVRDAVSLIREFEDGRKTLGKIEDIFALRERFLALDIDPDRAEERAREEAEAQREAELALAQNLEEAHRLIAEEDLDTVKDALWDFDQSDVLDVLYEHIAHEEPAAAQWVRRWEFITDQGHSRDNRIYSFELDEVNEVIRREGMLLAPRIARPQNWGGLPIAAHIAGERVKPLLIEGLETEDKYAWGVRAGARGLAAIAAADAVPRLAELAGELTWEDGDFHAEIERADGLLAVIEALGVLGGAEAAPALTQVLEHGPAKVHARALIALGRLGDPATVDAIAPFLDTEHSRPALFALAHIGSVESREALDACVGTMAGGVAALAYELAMQQYAAHRCGAEVDWDLVERLTWVIESKKYEDAELHETLVALMAAHPDELLAKSELRQYLHHDVDQVRTAAIDALEALGVDLELRWLDRPTVDAIWASEGVEGLRAALADDDAVFRHNVLRKAVDEGVADQLSDEAIELAELYCRFSDYTNGYVQDAHARTHYLIEALAHVGTDDALRFLCRLWKGANPMYRDADLLKYDRDGIQERLEPFVAEVVAELEADGPDGPETLVADRFADVAWLFGSAIHGVEWRPNGLHVAVGGNGGVKTFDREGQVVDEFDACRGAWVYDVTYSPDGGTIAAGAHAGHLWLLDADEGTKIAKLKGHSGVPSGVRKVRFSPSGGTLASVSDDQTLRFWDITQCRSTAVWKDPADVNTVDWLDEDRVVIGTDRMLRVIDAEGQELASASCSAIAEVRVHAERERIYVGNANEAIRVFTFDLEERENEALQCAAVARIRFVEDGLICASWEGEGVGVWHVPFDGDPSHWDGHHAATFGMDLDRETGGVFAGGQPGTVARWSADGEPIVSKERFHTDEVASIRFLDEEVVTASDDGEAIRWSRDGRAIAVYLSPEGRLGDAIVGGEHVFVTGPQFAGCFMLDGELVWKASPARSEHLCLTDDAVIVASYNQLLWLDRATGEVLHETEPFADSFIFRWVELGDERLAVAGYDDEQLFVWHTGSRELMETWELPSAERGGICHVASGGDQVFVSRWDSSVVVLDSGSGEVVKKAMLSGSRYPIAASPDGETLYAAVGGQIEVYDTSTFEQQATIEVGTSLEELAVSPDGTLFVGAESGELFRYAH